MIRSADKEMPMDQTPTAHPVPDQHGVNRYDSDPDLRALLSVYLPAP